MLAPDPFFNQLNHAVLHAELYGRFAVEAAHQQLEHKRFYEVMKREHLPVIEQARAGLFGDHKPADTVIGVGTLARPEYLIEVDTIAVTDR